MRILNFGSLNIDYVYRVDHLRPKARPSPRMRSTCSPEARGLNQSIALAVVPAPMCTMPGQVGRDGMFLRDLLESCAVGVTSVVVRDDVRSGNAIIKNDASGDNCIVLYPGTRTVPSTVISSIRCLTGYGKGDWLLLQNEISETALYRVPRQGRGMFIVLNPLRRLTRGSTKSILMPSAVLYSMRAGRRCSQGPKRRWGDTDPCDACAFLPGGYSPHPRRGAVRCICVGTTSSRSPLISSTRSTPAAGDTFTGYLLADLMSGEPIAHALISPRRPRPSRYPKRRGARRFPCERR